MYKYKTIPGQITITQAEIESETDYFVGIRYAPHGSVIREKKSSSYGRFFDTWAEARDALLAEAERDEQNARDLLKFSMLRTSKIRNLTPPGETP